MTNQIITLSRKQLTAFLPTQEAVRAFEYVFKVISSLAPQSYDSVISQLNSLTDEIYNLNVKIENLTIQNEILQQKVDDLEKSSYVRGVI